MNNDTVALWLIGVPFGILLWIASIMFLYYLIKEIWEDIKKKKHE